MPERKTELRIFTIADWEKEERYLRKRHREGWKFVKVGLPGIYHFEKCVPADVVYQLDYNQEGWPTRTSTCKCSGTAAGEYIQDFGGYSYFRKPVSECRGKRKSSATTRPGWT